MFYRKRCTMFKIEDLNDLPVVRSFWFGTPLTWICDLTMRSYISHGHKFILYSYDDISVPEGVQLRNANEIIPESESFQMMNSIDGIRGRYSTFSNIFRYKLLHDKGGFWTDMDSICIKPIKFEDNIEIVFATERTMTGMEINNCNIYVSQKGHPLLKNLYISAISKDRESLSHLSLNKQFILEMMDEMGIDWINAVAPIKSFCPIPWYEIRQIFLHDHGYSIEAMLNRSHSIHLFNNIIQADYPEVLEKSLNPDSFAFEITKYIK